MEESGSLITQEEIEGKLYCPYGGVWRLFNGVLGDGPTPKEVLMEGPADTGKTRGLLEYAYLLAHIFPGCRILFLRRYRVDLAESVLVTWEDKVLEGGVSHPCVTGTATREHRSSYTFPYMENVHDGVLYGGSTHVVLRGLDEGEKTYSMEYDFVFGFESIQFTLDRFEKLLRCLRNDHAPFQQLICDTNPGPKFHFLNTRFPEEPGVVEGKNRRGTGGRWRLAQRHEHNPAITEDRLDTLRGMTGYRRKTLYEGKWVAMQGLIYETFDPAHHFIAQEELPEMAWYFGGMDWGFDPDPGCFMVMGVDHEGRLYVVQEVLRRKKTIDWWAEVVQDAHNEYDLRAVVCDPSRNDNIQVLNDCLGEWRGRHTDRIARKADNDWDSGVDVTRQALQPRAWGPDEVWTPGLRWMAGRLKHGKDPLMVEESRPVTSTEEIVAYCLVETDEDKPRKEVADPTCDDHGCDTTRYMVKFAWRKDLTPKDHRPQFEGGSYGAHYGHETLLRGGKRRRRRSA